ncbi:hypothetical protein EMCRGX_G024116 [Ephydatia muelleri]
MVKRKKKAKAGAATWFLSRNQVLKKLQLSLPDFRRLCILKGIYPHEPKNKKKINHGSTAHKTYYYVKDIQFLAHEPLLEKFRDFRAFIRRVKRALNKGEEVKAHQMYDSKPIYTLDLIVKERYPTFIDAIRDLDDALSMIFLFATLPQYHRLQAHVVHNCRRLSVEFMNYVAASRSLRKTFLSIKGIYYQAEIEGQTVTWIVPHHFKQTIPSSVDLRVMLTFIEFYASLLGFINFKLYSSMNLKYPPQIAGLPSLPDADVPYQIPDPEIKITEEGESHAELLAALSQSLATVLRDEDVEAPDEDIPVDLSVEEDEVNARARQEEEKLNKFKKLFEGLRFFLSREVPREALTFTIRSFGGEVSWDSSEGPGSTYAESDEKITHHVVDRPSQKHRYLSRSYIQPQWVFDCINQRHLLPLDDYLPGSALPPHLSPFVQEQEGDYVPPEQEALKQQEGEEEEEVVEESKNIAYENEVDENADEGLDEPPAKKSKLSKVSVPVGTVCVGGIPAEEEEEETLNEQQAEEKRLAIMMMTKKKKKLYDMIMKSRKKKAKEVGALKRKRQSYDEARKLDESAVV